MTHTHELRRERLRAILAERNLPAMLVSLAANRFYLSGFELHDPQCNESAGMLAVTAKGPDYLFTDPRYEDAAKRIWDPDHLCIYTGDRFRQIGGFLKGRSVKSLGFETKALCVHTYEGLRKELELIPTENAVEELRLIKDAQEITAMRKSCALNHRVQEHMERVLPEFIGRTETDLAWEVERTFRENGAQELSFSTIAGVSENAALPHAVPGHRVVTENDHVLLDFGCRLDDYCSDQTRTFWAGSAPSDRFLKTRDMVKLAQKTAIDFIRPGVTCAQAYKAARDVFEKHGVADRFTHSLGHGIGLETHEPPSLSHVVDTPLKPGMIVTVEPGLYYPDWGGIRWEHMVLITEDGCDVLQQGVEKRQSASSVKKSSALMYVEYTARPGFFSLPISAVLIPKTRRGRLAVRAEGRISPFLNAPQKMMFSTVR